MTNFPRPPFDTPLQDRIPGQTEAMTPLPDHGESSYEGSGRLEGKIASSRAPIQALAVP